MNRYTESVRLALKPLPPLTLSMRELQALQSIAEGKTLREFAAEYGISNETAKDYIATARLKLGAVTTPHAVALACKAGVL